MELTAKKFLENKKMLCRNGRSPIVKSHYLGELLEEYHQAKMKEMKEKGLIRLKQEIAEHDIDGFYRGD
jgi:hypothetical protein